MCNSFHGRLWTLGLMALLAVGIGGCTVSDDTVSSLVDLTASTSGSLVEILIKAAVEALLAMGQTAVDLALPISQQLH